MGRLQGPSWEAANPVPPSARGTSWPSPGRRCTAPVPGCTSAAGPGWPSPGPALPPGLRSAGAHRRGGWQSSPSPRQSRRTRCHSHSQRSFALPPPRVSCLVLLPPQNRALNANAAHESQTPCLRSALPLPPGSWCSFNEPLFQHCSGGGGCCRGHG